MKFALYLARWQLSTPILWLVVSRLGTGIEATIIANLIGASIFFWVDRFIFRSRTAAVWETLHHGACADCGETTRVQRLVLAPGGSASPAGLYDRRNDPSPQYRCPSCSATKLKELRATKKIGSTPIAQLA